MVALLVLFGVAFLVRVIAIDAPYTDRFVWRSVENAAIARNFLQQGLDIRYPRVDWAGPEGFVEADFPIQTYLVALAYSLVGREVSWWGRASTLLIALLTFLSLARLSRILVGVHAALIALLIWSIVPTSVYFSRMFQQDMLMIFAMLQVLFHAWRWLHPGEEPLPCDAKQRMGLPSQWVHPLLVSTYLALAILIKPLAGILGIPLIYLSYLRHGPGLLWQPSLYLVALGALLPPALWYAHARGIYLEHGYTFGILGGGHDKFQWGRYLTQPSWYREMLERFATWHLTIPGLILSLIGARALLKKTWPGRGLLSVWLISMLLVIPLVAEGNLDMIYYQLSAIPPLTMVAALGFQDLWLHRWGRVLGIGMLISMPVFSFTHLRPAYSVVQVSHLRLAAAIRQTVPEGALLLDAGAYSEHNPGGYNYEPLQFYYSGHKGWCLLEEDFTLEAVEGFRRRGAQFLVSKASRMLERHPELIEALRARYAFVREEPGILIVDLRRPYAG